MTPQEILKRKLHLSYVGHKFDVYARHDLDTGLYGATILHCRDGSRRNLPCRRNLWQAALIDGVTFVITGEY